MKYVILEPLFKAGPFIGPRGGKWANPQHTIPWDPEKRKRQKKVKREDIPKRKWVDSLPGTPNETVDLYRKEDGTYTAERQKIHETIVEKALSNKVPPPKAKNKIAIVMMGGPASGKTSLVQSILKKDFQAFVSVNPDDVKEALPEWKPGLKGSARNTAGMLHRESSDVAGLVYKEALEEGYNLIVDGTGRDKIKHMDKVRALQAKGYHVTVLMPDLDHKEAWGRASQRAEATGRYVDKKVVKRTHHLIPGNFESIARIADSFGLFDNRGKPPGLVWSGNKGEKDRIHDEKFVRQFKGRGKRLHAKVETLAKSFYILEPLRKAAKPPYMTVEQMAAIITKAPDSVLYPHETLPKKYSKDDGIVFGDWAFEDPEYHK